MFDRFSDGFCPQCLLEDRQVEMLVNRMDLWECPDCGLQGAGGGPALIVQRERGKGVFKNYRLSATEHLRGVWLARQSVGDWATADGAFRDEAEFRAFLAHDVR